MLIIVVTDNVAEQELAGNVKTMIEKELPSHFEDSIPVGIASEEDVRQEDIVGYLHWQARQEEANNEKRNSD